MKTLVRDALSGFLMALAVSAMLVLLLAFLWLAGVFHA